MLKRREAIKKSLMRKSQITETMEQMRITNDFSLIEKLFAENTRKAPKGQGEAEAAEAAN